MAASVKFKQECPSCEALVPISDNSLVGKKIDCPKCKFRFKVEAPKDKEEEKKDAKPANGKPANGKGVTKTPPAKTAPAGKGGKPGKKAKADDDEDDDAPKKKKKGGSSMTLILGIGVGLVAVVGLIVGVFCFLPSGGSGNGGAAKVPGGKGTQSPTRRAGPTRPPSNRLPRRRPRCPARRFQICCPTKRRPSSR